MSQFLEFVVLVATVIGFLMGGLCIYWVKVRPSAGRARWGGRLFIATLLSLGATAFVAALVRADGLAPLGLLSGLLITGMLWESPVPAFDDDTFS